MEEANGIESFAFLKSSRNKTDERETDVQVFIQLLFLSVQFLF
jgi:hypothetical protein